MRPEELDERYVCYKCVEDPFLKAEIRATGKKSKCSYCEGKAKSFPFLQIADRVEKAFAEHHELTASEPTEWEYRRQHADKESTYVWYREGETVVDILVNDLGFEPTLADDIQGELENRYTDFDVHVMGGETEFDSGTQYESKGVSDEKWQEGWLKFERILKSESRYFNQDISNYLLSVFEGVEEVLTYDHKAMVTKVGPKGEIRALYRARVFQQQDRLLEALAHPDILLGTPDSENAKAGRMNASGIAVFYGSTSPEVALAEVRPPVGSRVAVARFSILRPLRLLDLTALSRARTFGSVFDPSYAGKLQKVLFLRNLSEKMTMPVMPDHELFEYLPTQVIADFLSSSAGGDFDGIIYPSVQSKVPANNVVLFHKASKVQLLDLAKGAEVHATDKAYEEEDEYERYDVREFVPFQKEIPRAKRNSPHYSDLHGYIGPQKENESAVVKMDTLLVDVETISVLKIDAVNFDTEEFGVYRNKIVQDAEEKSDPGIFKPF